jgi:hypothetical protein
LAVSQCAASGINTLLLFDLFKNDGALSPFFDCIEGSRKEHAENFYGGMAQVKIGSKFAYIKKNGKVIWTQTK